MTIIVQSPTQSTILVQQKQGPPGAGGLVVNGTGVIEVIAGVIQGTALGGANGNVLTWAGGLPVWAAPAASGITQLTADVTAGPGSGSQAATVVAVHGATVPAAGALVTGNVLQVTGASALGYAPVNLAGGATFVTGTLPVANLPNGTPDWTGAITSNTVVQAQGGVFGFGAGGSLTWSTGSTPLLTQASTSSATPAAMTITPQVSTAGSNQGGSAVVVNLSLPTGAGNTGYLQVNQAGVVAALLGASPLAGYSALFLAPGSNSPSYAQATILTNGVSGSTFFIANSGTAILGSTSANYGLAVSGSAAFFQPGYTVTINSASADTGGLVGGLDIAPRTTAPTALPTTHASIFVNGVQQFGLNAAGVFFPPWVTAPMVYQGVQTSDVAVPTLTIQAGAAYASAVTNVTGGTLALSGGNGHAGPQGPVAIQSALQLQIVTKSANYTIDSNASQSDYYVNVNSSGGARTITLPVPSAGRTLVIADSTGSAPTHNITIAQHASEQIQGLAASYVLSAAWAIVIIYSDGTNWFVK